MTAWVFCEELDGAPSASALELLTKARSWGDVEVFYVGAGSDAAYAALGDHGASKVHQVDVGDKLPAAAAAAALADLVDESDIALFGMGSTDRDVAGRLSARLGCPVLANAVEIDTSSGQVLVTNEILGGTTRVVTAATAGPVIVVELVTVSIRQK